MKNRYKKLLYTPIKKGYEVENRYKYTNGP